MAHVRYLFRYYREPTFHLQGVDGLVLGLELPLEGAIVHAATLAQQGDHLIQDCRKIHPLSILPSLCCEHYRYDWHGQLADHPA